MGIDNHDNAKSKMTADWIIRGVLTKFGEIFDRFTGRGWNPSSNLATSKLVEKLKRLIDSNILETATGVKMAPHDISLKVQWDKFSTDSEIDIGKLRNELHAAAIDHINDSRLHTFAPIKISIGTDYFTGGVKFHADFGDFAKSDAETDDLNVTIRAHELDSVKHPGSEMVELGTQTCEDDVRFEVSFIAGVQNVNKAFAISKGARLRVGRTRSCDIRIDDKSISKIHASLARDSDGNLIVADTGSTNGTFIGDERIEYGAKHIVADDSIVKFGNIQVHFLRAEFEDERIDDETFEPAKKSKQAREATQNEPTGVTLTPEE